MSDNDESILHLFDTTKTARVRAWEAQAARDAANTAELRHLYATFVALIRPLDGKGGFNATTGYHTGYDGRTRPPDTTGVWVDQYGDSVGIGGQSYRAARDKAGVAHIQRAHSGQPWEHPKVDYASPEEAARAFAIHLGEVAGDERR